MTLLIYMSRVIGFRIFAVAAAMTVLALGLDLLNNGADIIGNNEAGSLTRYMLLRAPLLALNTAPVAFLIGPVLAFLMLGAHSEIIVVRAAGMSAYRMIMVFMPLGLICGGLLFILLDQVAPRMEAALVSEFADAEDVRSARLQPEKVWIRSGTDVVRIGNVGAGGDDTQPGAVLSQISIFMLDKRSALALWVDAEVAQFDGERWLLTGVTERNPGGEVVETTDVLQWDTRLRPDFIVSLATATESVEGSTARGALDGLGIGPRGPAFYETRILRGYMVFALPFVLFLFAIPAGRSGGRSSQGSRYAVIGVFLGFCFLGMDGLMASLGETEITSPQTAAFAAPLAFAIIGFWVLLMVEE